MTMMSAPSGTTPGGRPPGVAFGTGGKKSPNCTGAAGGGFGSGVTTMVEALPVIESALSVSVSDCAPAVANVTENVA